MTTASHKWAVTATPEGGAVIEWRDEAGTGVLSRATFDRDALTELVEALAGVLHALPPDFE